MKPFMLGANYWASHAGLNMWHEWDAETIDSDLRRLSEHGVKVLRIFPLWSDFQPLIAIADCGNLFRQLGFPDGSPLAI